MYTITLEDGTKFQGDYRQAMQFIVNTNYNNYYYYAETEEGSLDASL